MATYTYPGVYIQEVPSQVHTITGVATSITAFVGYTGGGIDNRATQINSFSDYERYFGGLVVDSELSYAVQQFFANGGTQAYVVRVPKDGATPASVVMLDAASKQALKVTALSSGDASNNLLLDIDYNVMDGGVPSTDPNAFNLTILQVNDAGGVTVSETWSDVTMDSTKSNFVETVLNDVDTGSQLVNVKVPVASAARPAATGLSGGKITPLNIKNDKEYDIKMTINYQMAGGAPSTTDITIPFIVKNDPIPTSVPGVCRVLERTANAAIQLNAPAVLKGATIQCTPNATGDGLIISAVVPGAYDAQLTYDTGTADAFLQLNAGNATSNVAHYWPASKRTGAASFFSEAGITAGVAGTKLPTGTELIGNPLNFSGIYALDKVDLFNILCIPDVTSATAKLAPTDQNAVFSAAMTYCISRRAFLIVDPPANVVDLPAAENWIMTGLTLHDTNGAAYFPRLRLSDPLNNNTLRTFAPCGVVAGLYARIDAARGVWKAPAGVEAILTGVQSMVYKLNDAENGSLNPLGLNCFRTFPIYGPVSWGARTLVGADQVGSEWKYVPVRRFALFLEESLYRGTKWVVFEPNDEPLWAQIRLNLTAFMMSLFRQGAFQGTKPSDAFFVKCDSETTTQNDINQGVVNILVGFAPLKPAEFVVIKISQIAGQVV